MRCLRKIRRAAAPARDLDVHRKLLDAIAAQCVPPGQPAPSPGEISTPPPAVRAQAAQLDDWLHHSRRQAADTFQTQVATLLAKFDKRLAGMEQVLAAAAPTPLPPPLALALDSFARLAADMQSLHAENLHAFRKGAKKARYLAELAGKGDPRAARVARSLRSLQDQIGEWHDWLVLVGEARTALGDNAAELVEELEAQRDDHFIRAMNSAIRLRARLMQEWMLVRRPPARRAPSSVRRPSAVRQAHPHRTGTEG
jgi:CHAD domain-containing protein